MSSWYVWTKRDTGAGGWEFEASASSVPEPALDRLIAPLASNEGFPQLEPLTLALPSTEGVPIVSAVWEDTLGRWVFVLRGRGGRFGVAGATQVSVAPAGLPLALAWPAFWSALGPDGIADEAILDASWADPPTAPSEAILGVLRLAAHGADYAEVDADPAEVATLFGAALPLLPEGIARRCCWSTLHVARRGLRPVVIAGRWPDELQKAWRTKYQRLAKPDDSLTSLRPGDEVLLAWWVDQPDHGWAAESDATTWAEFIDDLHRRRPLDIGQIRALVASHQLADQQVQRIVREPELLRALTEDDPELGWQVLRSAPQGLPAVAPLTARLLLTDTNQAVESRGQLRKEVLAQDAHRSKPLTDSLDPTQRLKLAHMILDESLGQDAELARARPWLLDLGITQEAAPDFFGFVAEEVARLAATDPDAALAEIGEGAQKWDRLHDVIHELGPHAPATAHLLVASVTDDPRVGAPMLQSITPTSVLVQIFARDLGRLITGRPEEVMLRHRLATTLTRWASPTKALDRQAAAALLELAVGIPRTAFMVEPVAPVSSSASSRRRFEGPRDDAELSPPQTQERTAKPRLWISGDADVPTEKLPEADRDGLNATSATAQMGSRTESLPAIQEDRAPLRRLVKRSARAGLIVLVLVGVIVLIVLTSGAFK